MNQSLGSIKSVTDIQSNAAVRLPIHGKYLEEDFNAIMFFPYQCSALSFLGPPQKCYENGDGDLMGMVLDIMGASSGEENQYLFSVIS